MKGSYLIILLALAQTISVVSQDKIRDSSNGDGERNVSLTFVRIGKRKPLSSSESSDGIWLSLNNRSKFTLLVPTIRYEKVSGRKGDGIEAVPVYSVECSKPNKNCESVPSGIDRNYTGNGLIPSFELKPGHSWLVSIPKNHLSEGLGICVRFAYRGDRKSENVDNDKAPHRVCFQNEDLPRMVRQVAVTEVEVGDSKVMLPSLATAFQP